MILAAIENWAETRPSHDALVSGTRTLSYAQLRDAIQYAQDEIGVFGSSPGVALICIEDMIIAWPWLLALRSLGYTTLATTPETAAHLTLPVQSVSLVLSVDAISEPSLHALPLSAGARVVSGVKLTEVFQARPAGDPRSLGETTGGHLMLSSGTTGRPKMVLFTVEHEIVGSAFNTVNYSLPEDAVWCGNFPLMTAAGYRLPLGMWSSGGTVILNQGPDVFAPFENEKLTFATVTPGMLAQYLAREDRGRFNEGLTIAVVGGHAHWPDIVRARQRLAPQIVSYYGSTEAGALSHTVLDTEDDLKFGVLESDRVIQIVDEDGHVLGAGEVGILRADLKCGVTEYWNDPDTSARVFRDGFFYPGDTGRITDDGRLELLGRTDDVLVWRGDKIASGPLEREIRARTGVSDVCMFVEDTDAGQVLVIALEGSGPQMEEAVRQVLTDFGNRPLIEVKTIPVMPRNAMGKLIRRELRATLKDL